MNIPALKKNAASHLSRAQNRKQIAFVYAGISVAAALLIVLIQYLLDLRIAQTGGLGNLGTRSLLSAIQNFLPMVKTLAMLCLELGFLSAMMRISRDQYTSLHSLRAGMPRFWAMLRASLLQSLLYIGAGIAAFYVATTIFLATPLSSRFTEITMSIFQHSERLDPTALILDDATYLAIFDAIKPMFLLLPVMLLLLGLPIFYRYRMVNYILLDKPACGALAAMRESAGMMKGNTLSMFKLDVSLWWYFLASAAAAAVCYADALLAMAGINLPLSEDVAYFLFYGLYLIVEFMVLFFLHPKAGVVYAAAYNAIKPEEPRNSGGVVLGNIFQM